MKSPIRSTIRLRSLIVMLTSHRFGSSKRLFSDMNHKMRIVFQLQVYSFMKRFCEKLARFSL